MVVRLCHEVQTQTMYNGPAYVTFGSEGNHPTSKQILYIHYIYRGREES